MDYSTIKQPVLPPFLRLGLLPGLGVLGILLVFLANLSGFWWGTILMGILIGVSIQRGRHMVVLSFLVGGIGWASGLLYQAFFLPVAAVATLVAEILGLGRAGGWIVIAATILQGVILCASGAWFGLALRSLIPLSLRKPIDEMQQK